MDLLHERLKSKRTELGWSLSDASKASGVSRSYLYQLESGTSIPAVDKLQALARAYGTTVGYLIGETKDDLLAALVVAQARLYEAIEAIKEAKGE